MITHFQINSIKTHGESDMLYVDVTFFENNLEVHHNDFLMQVYPTRRVYIGPVLADGEAPDQANYEIQDTDVLTEILANIRRYIPRINPNTFDYRSPKLKQKSRDVDPLGVIARVPVQYIGRKVAIVE